MTGNQILQLRKYEDRDPVPVIILLDNPDDEKLATLTAWVEQKARESGCEEQRQTRSRRIWCVLLLCKRISLYPPKHSRGSFSVLKQELTPDEISWFQQTHIRLEVTHKKNKGPDPRYLISFNILKSGFDRSQIKSTVKEFVEDVRRNSEKCLLKYVALLSTYHLNHRYAPLAVFDNMMSDIIPRRRFGGARRHMASDLWECHLSTACEILLDRIEGSDHWCVRSIGIIHPVLSEELLKILLQSEQQTTGSLAMAFLNDPYVFLGKNAPLNILLRLVRDIFVMRERRPDGKHATRFSPLVEQVMASESTGKAQDLFLRAYHLTENPFVAQHVARFFIYLQRWDEAEQYATEATNLMPDNSYLWDTYAQIYREKLFAEYQTLRKDKQLLSTEHAINIIDIAHRATRLFKQVQAVSEKETQSPIANSSGFYGAIRIFITLMNCLCFMDVFPCLEPREVRKRLRKILEGNNVPPELAKWKSIRRTNYITVLQDLAKEAQASYNRLGDEQVQLRENHYNDQIQSQHIRSQEELDNLKADLEPYFGRARGEIPPNISEDKQCHLRRRCVYSLAGPGIRDIFKQKQSAEHLCTIQQYMLENLNTSSANADDYRILITACLALIASEKHSLIALSYRQLADFSRILYEKRETVELNLLEPYLYFTMFNWPRDNIASVEEPKTIMNALAQWKAAFGKKYKRQREEGRSFGQLPGIHRKKETVMFFFAPNKELQSIVTYDQIRQPGLPKTLFWRDPQTLRKMQRFKGVLGQNGREVTIALTNKKLKEYITIPTSFPIQEKNLYNKQVYFLLGFSWLGPKAFDVVDEIPNEQPAEDITEGEHDNGSSGLQNNGWQVQGRQKGKRGGYY